MEFIYKLEKSSKKYTCPKCDKKTYVRYVDDNGNYPEYIFGRCDREQSCGYLNIPNDKQESVGYSFAEKKVIQPSLIPYGDGANTFKDYDKNSFCKWLMSKVGVDKFNEALEMYQFGICQDVVGCKEWVIFWQVDIDMNCRSGKIIKYGIDGRRDKNSFTTWFHKVKKYDDFNLVQCFYGEHLLSSDERKPIAIVESEKTAIIASCFIDGYIWLSSGGKGGLNKNKCKVLDGRNVTLFPDLGAYEDWNEKAKELGFKISDALEKRSTEEEKKQGLDIADYLIK